MTHSSWYKNSTDLTCYTRTPQINLQYTNATKQTEEPGIGGHVGFAASYPRADNMELGQDAANLFQQYAESTRLATVL